MVQELLVLFRQYHRSANTCFTLGLQAGAFSRRVLSKCKFSCKILTFLILGVSSAKALKVVLKKSCYYRRFCRLPAVKDNCICLHIYSALSHEEAWRLKRCILVPHQRISVKPLSFHKLLPFFYNQLNKNLTVDEIVGFV